MAAGIVQEAYQQLRADVQNLLILQQTRGPRNNGGGSGGGTVRYGSAHRNNNKSNTGSGDSTIVSRARNQIHQQLAVLKRSILSVRLTANAVTLHNPLPAALKSNHNTFVTASVKPSSPPVLGQLRAGSFKKGRHKKGGLHKKESAEWQRDGEDFGAGIIKQGDARSATMSPLGCAVDSKGSRMSFVPPPRSDVSGPSDSTFAPLTHHHHPVVPIFAPPRLSMMSRRSEPRAEGSFFESASRLSISPQTAAATGGGTPGGGHVELPGGVGGDEFFSEDHRNTVSQWWGGSSQAGGEMRTGVEKRKAVIHHVDHATAQAAMKMRRGYGGFGFGTAAGASSTTASTGVGAAREIASPHPLSSSGSKMPSQKKKRLKGIDSLEDKLVKKSSASVSLLRDTSSDSPSLTFRIRSGEGTTTTATPITGAVSSTISGALPIATLEASLAVVKECHEHAVRFLHLGLCKDAKMLFLDSVNEEVSVLRRIAFAIVPTLDEEGRINGQIPVVDVASSATSGVVKNERKMEENDYRGKDIGKKSSSAHHGGTQGRKPPVLAEEELPIALQAHHRAFQHELLTCVATFYNILNKDPFLDTMGETVMGAARQVELVVELLFRMLSTPSFLAGNTPAVWGNCKMAALQPQLTTPGGGASAVPSSTSTGGSPSPSHRAEGVVHPNLVVAQYLLSDLLAIREADVPRTSFPDGSMRQEKRYPVAESGYYMLFNGSIYVYEMSMYLLRRLQNCLCDMSADASGNSQPIIQPGDVTEWFGKIETVGGESGRIQNCSSGGSTKAHSPAAAAAVALLPDVYRLCIRHVGACIEISDAGRFQSLLKLATVKYLPWRIKMFDFLMQCMESMNLYAEALQVAQQEAHSVRFLLELECSDPVPPPPAFMKVLEHAAEHTMLQMMRYGWYDLISSAWRQRAAAATGGESSVPLGTVGEMGSNSGSFPAPSPTGASAASSGASPTSAGTAASMGGGGPTPLAPLSTVFTILPEHSSVSTVSPMTNSTAPASTQTSVGGAPLSPVVLGEGYGVSLTLPIPHHGRELLDMIWRVVEKTSLPFAMHQKKLDTSATAAAMAAASASLNAGNARGVHKKAAGGNPLTSTVPSPISMEQTEILKLARKEEEAQYTYYMAQQFQQHVFPFLISLFVYQSLEMDPFACFLSGAGSPVGGQRNSNSGEGFPSMESATKVSHSSGTNMIGANSAPAGKSGVAGGGSGGSASSTNLKDGTALGLLSFSHLRQCAIEALEVLMQYMSIHYFIDPVRRQEMLRGDISLYPFAIPTVSFADENSMKTTTLAYLDEVQSNAVEMAMIGGGVSSGRSRSASFIHSGGGGRRGGAGTSGRGDKGTLGGRVGSGSGRKASGVAGGPDKGIIAALQQLRAPPKERIRIAEDPDFITTVRLENYFPAISSRFHQIQQRVKAVKPTSTSEVSEECTPGDLGATQPFGTHSFLSGTLVVPPGSRVRTEAGRGNTGASTGGRPMTSPRSVIGSKKGPQREEAQGGGGSKGTAVPQNSKGKRNCLPPIGLGLSTPISMGGSSHSFPSSSAFAQAMPEGPILSFPVEDEIQKELVCMLQVIRYLYLTKNEALFYRSAATLDHFLRGALLGSKYPVGAGEGSARHLSTGNMTVPSTSKSPTEATTLPLPGSGKSGGDKGAGAKREGDKQTGTPESGTTSHHHRLEGKRSPSPPTLSPTTENRTRETALRTRDGPSLNSYTWNRLVHSGLSWIHLLESLRYSVLTMRFQKRALDVEEVLLIGPYYIPPAHPFLEFFMRCGGYLPDVGKLVGQVKTAEVLEVQVISTAPSGGGGHGKSSGRGVTGVAGRDGKGVLPVLSIERGETHSHPLKEVGTAGGIGRRYTGMPRSVRLPIPSHPYPLVSPLLPAARALRTLADVLTPGGASTRCFGEGPLLGCSTSASVAAAAVFEEVMQAVGRFLIETGTDSIQYRRKERNARIQQGITGALFQDPEQTNAGALPGENTGLMGSIQFGERSEAELRAGSPLTLVSSFSGEKTHTCSNNDSYASPEDSSESSRARCRTAPAKCQRTEDEVDEEEERAYFDVVVNSISGMVTSGLTNEMSVGEFAIQLATSALDDLAMTEKPKRDESDQGKPRSASGGVGSARTGQGSVYNDADGEEEPPLGLCAGQALNKTLLRPYAEVGNIDMVGPYLKKIEEMENGRTEDVRHGAPLFPDVPLGFLQAATGGRRNQKEVQTIKLLERSRLALSFVKTALSMVTTRHKHFTESGIYQGKKKTDHTADVATYPLRPSGTNSVGGVREEREVRSSGKGGENVSVVKTGGNKPGPFPSFLRGHLQEMGEEAPCEVEIPHFPSPYRSRPSYVLSTFREHAVSQRVQEGQAVFLGNALRDCRTYLTRLLVELRYHVACLRGQVAVYTKHHEDITQLLKRHRNTKVFGAVTAKDARILQTLLSEDPELPESTDEEEAKLLTWSGRDPALRALVLLCLANVLPSPRHRRERLDAAMETLRSITQINHHQPQPTDPYSLIIIWGFAASASSTLRAMAHSTEAKKVLYQHYLSPSSISCFSAMAASSNGRLTDLSLAEVIMKNHLNTNDKIIANSSELALLNFSGALMDLAAAEMETSRRKKGRMEKENPPEPHAVAIGIMSDWEWNRQHQVTGLFCASSALLALRLLERISSSVAASRLIFPCVNLMFNCLLPCLGDPHFNAVILLPIVSMTFALLDFEGEGWGEAVVQLLALRILQALKTHVSLGGVAGRGLTLQEQQTQCNLSQLLYITFAHVWNRVLAYPNMRQWRYFQHVNLDGLRTRYVYAQSLSAIEPEEDPENSISAGEGNTSSRPKSRGSGRGPDKSAGSGAGGSNGRGARNAKEAVDQAAVAAAAEAKTNDAKPVPESFVFPGSPFVPSPSQPHVYDQVPVEYLELMEELLFHDPVMGCSILHAGGSTGTPGGVGGTTSRRGPLTGSGTGMGGGGMTGGGGRAPSAGGTGTHSSPMGMNMSPLRPTLPAERRSKVLGDETEWKAHLDRLLRPQPLAGIPWIIVETVTTLGSCLSAMTSNVNNSGGSSGNPSTSSSSTGASGGTSGSGGGGGVHFAPVTDVLAKYTGDLLYTKVVHRTMECLLRLEDFTIAKSVGHAALETMKSLEVRVRQWLMRLHRGFFSWLALNGYIFADSRRIQEEKEAQERRKTLESKRIKDGRAGRKGTPNKGNKKKTAEGGGGATRNAARKGNKKDGVSSRPDAEDSEANDGPDEVHFLEMPREWNSAEQQMLRQTTRALGWIRRRRADRFVFRRITAFNRLVSSQIRLYLAIISKLETMEVERKKKYQEERWQYFHAKSIFGGVGPMHGGGHSHLQDGKQGITTSEKINPFTGTSSGSSKGIGNAGGTKKVANPVVMLTTDGSKEDPLPADVVFTKHCANAAAILNNAFLSSQAIHAVCMAVDELRNGALAEVPDAYLLAMREERRLSNSLSFSSSNGFKVEGEENNNSDLLNGSNVTKGSFIYPSSPSAGMSNAAFPAHGNPSLHVSGILKEGGDLNDDGKTGRVSPNPNSPSAVPHLTTDLTQCVDGETMRRLKELSPLLIRLATELLFSLTSIQRGYCDHRRDIEVVQPTATKTGIFCCLAEQIHFQGFVPSLYSILSPAGQFEEQRISRLAPHEHGKTKRIKRRRLEECIMAENVSRESCVNAYRNNLISLLNQFVLVLPRLQKHRETLIQEVQDDSSDELANAVAEEFLILHSQAHRNGDMYCTMDAHEAHATLRRAAMNCPALVHFPFEVPEEMKFTTEERIRQLQLGYDLPEEIILEMILFLLSGMQFTAQREALDLCNVANEITNHRFASVLLPIAIHIEDTIGTHTPGLSKAFDAVKKVVPIGKAALATARLNWKWYTCTPQYQRVLKRLSRSLFPPLLGSKKREGGEEHLGIGLPPGDADGHGLFLIENRPSNQSRYSNSSSQPASGATLLGGLFNMNVKTVLASYHRAAARLREFRDFGALSECLLELGQVYFLHRNKAEAEATWLEALDAAVEIPRVLFNWRSTVWTSEPRSSAAPRCNASPTSVGMTSTAVSTTPNATGNTTFDTASSLSGLPTFASTHVGSSPSQGLPSSPQVMQVGGASATSSSTTDTSGYGISFSIESIGLTRLFMALCNLSSLAMYSYREDQGKAIDCYLLAASLVWSFYRRGASVNFPERPCDFVDFSMNDIVVTMYLEESVREKVPVIVHHLLFLSHELQQFRYYNFAGMMGSLTEYMAARYLQDPKLVVEARLIRAKAAAGGGNFGSAMRLLRSVCQGAQLPSSLFSVLPIPSRCSVVDCSATNALPASGIGDKKSGKGGGPSSATAIVAASAAAAGPSAGGDGNTNTSSAGSSWSNNLVGVLGTGGRAVGKDIERRLYNHQELPTSPANVQSISTFVTDCFPHIHMDLQSGPVFLHGGSGGASSSNSNSGGGGAASMSSGTFSIAGGAGSASSPSNFLHEEVCELYGMLLSKRVILTVAEVLIMLGGREAAYLWPYEMSPVTGIAMATAGAAGPMGGGGAGGAVTMGTAGGSSVGTSGSLGAGVGGLLSSSGNNSGTTPAADNVTGTRRPQGRENRVHRNSFGSGTGMFGMMGSGPAWSGNSAAGIPVGGGGGAWAPQRTACTEALKAGEFLLEPFLQKEVVHFSPDANTFSGGGTTKKGVGAGGGAPGSKMSGAAKQGHGGGKAGQGGGTAAGGGYPMVWPGGAGSMDAEQDLLFQGYQQRLEEAGCLRHHAILLKAMAIAERGHSRIAISLLEEEIHEYNRAVDDDEIVVSEESRDSLTTLGERKYSSGALVGGAEEIRMGRSLKAHRSSSPVGISPFPQGVPLPSGNSGQPSPVGGTSTKRKRATHPTQLGLGFNIEKVSNVPSYILSLRHTHWCRVWYGLTVNYFRLRAFRKMEKAAQEGILLCERCSDPYTARIFSVYRATALAQRGFLKEAIETVKALGEATTKLSVGPTDPYEAWSLMAVEWLKRMALVQEGGAAVATAGGGGIPTECAAEGIWPTVMPLLQQYAEFCGLLPWEKVENEENPNAFSWKVRMTSTSPVSLCQALVSVKLHTVMNAAAEMKLKRYLGRRLPEDHFVSGTFGVGANGHRSALSNSGGGSTTAGSIHSKMKSRTAAAGMAYGGGLGSGSMTVPKGGGPLALTGGTKSCSSPRSSPLGSPRCSRYAGGALEGGGGGGGAVNHMTACGWQMDLVSAVDLLEQATQGLSSQYDTSAYPSLLVESKLLLAQALLLTRYAAREEAARTSVLPNSSLLPVFQGRGDVTGFSSRSGSRSRLHPRSLLLTDEPVHGYGVDGERPGEEARGAASYPKNYDPSEELHRESFDMSMNSSRNVKDMMGGTIPGRDPRGTEQRMIASLPGSTGKQRRPAGGAGMGGMLGGYLSNNEGTSYKISSSGAGGGGILSSQRSGFTAFGTASRRRSSAITAAESIEHTLSTYIPDWGIQRICKLLLETAESTVSGGTHDFRVLRLALLEIATLLSRYDAPSYTAHLEEEETEESRSGASSDVSLRRDRAGSVTTVRPLSAVAASCTILAYLVQEMMHHVSSGANAFHIYNTDESTIMDSLSLQERFPDFVMAAIHSTVSGVGQLAELSSAESSVVEQQQRVLLHPPVIMTVSPFYSDLLVNSTVEGGGGSKRGGVSNNSTTSFSGSNPGSGRGGGGPHSHSQTLMMMMNDVNGVLAAGGAITGNPSSLFLHTPMPVTVQDMAHTFATLQRERGLYVVAPPLEALNHETALLQLRSYLQEKTTPPTCTYLCYPNELRRQCAKQLLPSRGGAGGASESGGGAGGVTGGGGSASVRGGNKKDHMNITQQQQLDNMELWHALVPPVMLKTLPPYFFTPTGADRLGASKINTVIAQSFISASYDPRRQGCDQMPGMEEAGMVTLLLSVSPYYDPSITQPPPIATAADRKRLLVASTGDVVSIRPLSSGSNLPSERVGSAGSSGRLPSSGGLGSGSQFKNRLAAVQVQLESRSVHVDGPLQDRLQELAQMDSGAGPGAHLGIYGPGYDPENENSKKGWWTCVSFELPKKVVEELHRQALQVLHWYALEESDQRKHPESAAAAAAAGGIGVGGSGAARDISAPSSLAETCGGVNTPSNLHNNSLYMGTAGGAHHGAKGQSASGHPNSTAGVGHSSFPHTINAVLSHGTGGSSTGGLGVPGSGSSGAGSGPSAVGFSASGATPSPLGVGVSPAFSTLYITLQQSLLALQQKCHQQQMAHAMGSGGTNKRGVGGGGMSSGGSAGGVSGLGSGGLTAPKGLLGDTSAIFLTGVMAGATGYLSGTTGGGNVAAGGLHTSTGGSGANSSSSNSGGTGGGSSAFHGLPGNVGGLPTGSTGSGAMGNTVSSTISGAAIHSNSSGATVLGSFGGVGGGNGYACNTLSCDFTERYYQQQQATREEESRKIVKQLDECKSLLLMNWIESIIKNYVARSMADEALMEACVQQLLPTCAFSKEVVEFLAHWLTNDGGSAKFFHPGVHDWMRKIANFIMKMRRGTP